MCVEIMSDNTVCCIEGDKLCKHRSVFETNVYSVFIVPTGTLRLS
jgi:hypothetical protein